MPIKTLYREFPVSGHSAANGIEFGKFMINEFKENILIPSLVNSRMVEITSDTINFIRKDKTELKFSNKLAGNGAAITSGSPLYYELFSCSGSTLNFNEAKKCYFCEITYYQGDNGFIILSNNANTYRNYLTGLCYGTGENETHIIRILASTTLKDIAICENFSGESAFPTSPSLDLAELTNMEQIVLVQPLGGVFTLDGLYRIYFKSNAIRSDEINIAGKGTFTKFYGDLYFKTV